MQLTPVRDDLIEAPISRPWVLAEASARPCAVLE